MMNIERDGADGVPRQWHQQSQRVHTCQRSGSIQWQQPRQIMAAAASMLVAKSRSLVPVDMSTTIDGKPHIPKFITDITDIT